VCGGKINVALPPQLKPFNNRCHWTSPVLTFGTTDRITTDLQNFPFLLLVLWISCLHFSSQQPLNCLRLCGRTFCVLHRPKNSLNTKPGSSKRLESACEQGVWVDTLSSFKLAPVTLWFRFDRIFFTACGLISIAPFMRYLLQQDMALKSLAPGANRKKRNYLRSTIKIIRFIPE